MHPFVVSFLKISFPIVTSNEHLSIAGFPLHTQPMMLASLCVRAATYWILNSLECATQTNQSIFLKAPKKWWLIIVWSSNRSASYTINTDTGSLNFHTIVYLSDYTHCLTALHKILLSRQLCGWVRILKIEANYCNPFRWQIRALHDSEWICESFN